MNDINRWIGGGRLTADPEQKHLHTGSVVTDFSLAVNRAYKTHGGELREEVSYIKCSAYGKLGEIVMRYCHKGRQVIVDGRLRQDRWTDQDGTQRSAVRVICDAVQFVGPKSGGDYDDVAF